MPEKKIIFLVYADSQNNPLGNLREERQAVQDIFDDLPSIYDVKVFSNPTREYISEQLNKHAKNIVLFNYSGHAEDSLLLIDDNITLSEGIGGQLRNAKGLKLVVLNGCSTEGHVNTFLNIGAPVVVATECPVYDKSACEFAKFFYKSLIEDQLPILEAMAKGVDTAKTVSKPVETRFIDEQHQSLIDKWIARLSEIMKNRKNVTQTRFHGRRYQSLVDKWSIHFREPTLETKKIYAATLTDEEEFRSQTSPVLKNPFEFPTTEIETNLRIPITAKNECDRVEQFGAWRTSINSAKHENEPLPKFQFYYLHGHDAEEHGAFLERLEVFLNKGSTRKIKDSRLEKIHTIQYPEKRDKVSTFVELKNELLATISTAFRQEGMSPFSGVKFTNIAHFLKQNNIFSGLSADDYLIFQININEKDWNKAQVEETTKWLIEDFFLQDSPQRKPDEDLQQLPYCFIFFSIVYESKKAIINKEVQDLLKKAKYTIELDELESITYDMVKTWFDRNYRSRFRLTARDREEAIDDFYAELKESKKNEIPMADVILGLDHFIEKINSNEKHEVRNR